MTQLLSTMRACANSARLTLKLYKLAWPLVQRVANAVRISYVYSDRSQIVYLERKPDELDTIAHAIQFNSLGIPVKHDGEDLVYLYGWPNCIWLAWKLRNI